MDDKKKKYSMPEVEIIYVEGELDTLASSGEGNADWALDDNHEDFGA